MRSSWWGSLCLAGVVALAVSPAIAQEPKTARLAAELGERMSAAELTYLVARDAAGANRFVGAFLVPEVYLRIVSAEYSVPELLSETVRKREYQEAYVELSGASALETRTFIDDIGINGLRPRPPDSVTGDTYRVGTERVSFNGDWREQSLTQEAYQEKFAEAEAEYLRVLEILMAQLSGSSEG